LEEPNPIATSFDNQSTSNVKISYFNARSIVNKKQLLLNFITNCVSKYDMIFVTETWLNEAKLDSMFCANMYSVIRYD